LGYLGIGVSKNGGRGKTTGDAGSRFLGGGGSEHDKRTNVLGAWCFAYILCLEEGGLDFLLLLLVVVVGITIEGGWFVEWRGKEGGKEGEREKEEGGRCVVCGLFYYASVMQEIETRRNKARQVRRKDGCDFLFLVVRSRAMKADEVMRCDLGGPPTTRQVQPRCRAGGTSWIQVDAGATWLIGGRSLMMTTMMMLIRKKGPGVVA
jgi:hypothetical protein